MLARPRSYRGSVTLGKVQLSTGVRDTQRNRYAVETVRNSACLVLPPCQIQLNPTTDRGEHSIEDELVFSNNDGYIFHDSRGFESGDDKELRIVQKFVQQKSGERRLANRLHAIWYCIPMDNQRPKLELKHFKDICPDKNVPVVAVFTKFEQFKRNIKMHLEDHPNENLDGNAADVLKRRFEEDYQRHLGDGARFVQLEKMHKPDGCCKKLIEETAVALSHDVVTLMLLAVQRSNVELSVKLAVTRVLPHLGGDAEDMKKIVRTCLVPFPYIWDDHHHFLLLDGDLLFDDDDFLFLDDDFLFDDLDLVHYIMSMSILKMFSTGRSTRHHLVIAIITIVKHATTLCPSGLLPWLALAQAESDYKKSNIGSKAVSYFTEPLEQYSVQQFVDFIVGADLSD